MSNDPRGQVSREPVSTTDAMPPAGPYSQAVRSGRLLFISGQGPFDTEGRLVGSTFVEQATATFRNIESIARAAGGSLDGLVRIGAYLRTLDDFAAFNEVMSEVLSPPFPARTTVPVDLPGFDIEIDAIVALPEAQ
jgi:2-iminobutanoate/2-iminopropanoate deaminase